MTNPDEVAMASASGHSVGTATFPLEEDLVNRFAPLMSTVLGIEGARYRCEVELGARIADIVAWSSPTSVQSDALAPLRRAKVGDLAILAHLLERPLSARSLAGRIHADPTFVEQRLAFLKRSGLVHCERHAYALGVWTGGLPTAVLAVEAKLADWRTAVQQATYYSKFANAAWVLLPAHTPGAEDAKRACKEVGVGLLLFDGATVATRARARINQGPPFLRRQVKLRLAWHLARNANG